MRSLVLPLVLSTLALGCERHDETSGGAAPSPRAASSNEKAPVPVPSAKSSPTPSAESPKPFGASEPPSMPTVMNGTTTWKLGELADVAPAAPASASASGIAVIAKDGRLHWAKLDGEGHFGHVALPAADFARYGRGPALTESHAYFVNRENQLMRARVDGTGEAVRIAEHARPGARVSALHVGKRDLVAFVGEAEGRSLSYLWASTGELTPLTAAISGATSVTLVANGTTPLALTLEGRASLSPVHAQVLRVAPLRVNVPEPEVVWVGPGSEPLTELSAVPTTRGATLALLATARSITEFGLGQFTIEDPRKTVEDVHWLLYPNGIDPAPVSAATLCGAPYVFFARPSDARPRSPQELRVSRVVDGKIALGEVIAQSRAFNDVSVAARPGGAVLSWTADHRTWAMTLGCPER